MASFVLLASRLKNTRLTRSSKRPLRSNPSIVSAKLGGAAELVIASISAICSCMPRSKAGGKCSGRMRSNGGMPNGVVQLSKNGFPVIQLSGAIPLAVMLGGALDRSREGPIKKTTEEARSDQKGAWTLSGLAPLASTDENSSSVLQATIGPAKLRARDPISTLRA